MLKFVVKRLSQVVVVLFLILTVLFVLFCLSPDDPV